VRRIVVYVAGPYRSPTESGVFDNIMRARAIAIELWRPGIAVICPHLNTAFFGGSQPDSVWFDGDLEIILRCDALVTVPNWERSEGTKAEVAHAKRNGIPVFHHTHEFLNWAFRSRAA